MGGREHDQIAPARQPCRRFGQLTGVIIDVLEYVDVKDRSVASARMETCQRTYSNPAARWQCSSSACLFDNCR